MRSERPAIPRFGVCAALLLVATAAAARADDYLRASRTVGPVPHSATERFTFTLEKGAAHPHLALDIRMTRGRADVRVLDPAGRALETQGARECTLSQPIRGATVPGTYAVEVTTADAVGRWELRVFGGPPPPTPPPPLPALAGAAGMLLVALAAVAYWRRRTGVAWRWFWAGAAVWAVAVAVKFAIAVPLNAPLLGALARSLPRWAYLAAGSVYGGLMTGVTEVLFTLIAALLWRRWASTAARAVAVGVGAGAFEAALLAVAGGIAAVAAGAGATTWSVAFAPAAERLIAILCHVAARTLVLFAVARGQAAPFWYGFALMSGIDAVAMFLHLSGRVATMSPWAIEALLLPFAAVSLPLTAWCVRRWPAARERRKG
jgi:uncharacterized membrane protein YhfC